MLRRRKSQVPRTREQDRAYQAEYVARKSADPVWLAAAKERRKIANAKRYAKRIASPELKAKHHDWIKKLRIHKPHEYAIYRIRNRYKVTNEHAEQLIKQKALGCEVCGSTQYPHLDHCHMSGNIRGILCRGCNVTLGQVSDNPKTLRALADYLEAHT